MTGVRRLLVVAAVALTLLTGAAVTATAAGTIATASGMSTLDMPDVPTGRDCLNPPVPANPLSGFAYGIDPGPERPVPGDPFAQGSPATMYDRYGYAGYGLGVFDTPNKLDICQPITVDRDLDVANRLVDATLGWTAITVRMTRLVTSGTFGAVWDPIQQSLLSTVGGRLFLSTIGIAMMAAAVYVIWRRGRRGQIAQTAGWAARAGIITVAAALCMFFTIGVGAAIDRGIALGFTSAGEMVTQANGRDTADIVGITMMDYIVYPAWQRAVFGDDTTARDKFSERLWKAGTFTREEQAEITRNPGSAQGTIDTRREQYKAIMGEIREQHPQTYRRAAGMDTGQQMLETLAGLVAAGSGLWFLIVCLVLMLYGSAVARVAVGLFPAIAVPAVFPRLHHLASELAGHVVSAAWRAFVAAFAFFAYLVACVGAIMRSGLHPLVKTVAVLVIGRIVYAILKRFGIVPNRKRRKGRKGKKGSDGKGGRGGRGRSGKSRTNEPGQRKRRDRDEQDPQPAPAEARMRPRRAPAVTATARVHDLGELRTARTAEAGRSAAKNVTVAVASKAHPAAAAALTVAQHQRHKAIAKTAVTARELPGSRTRDRVGPPPTRRALPASPSRPNIVTREGVARAPRTYRSATAAGLRPIPDRVGRSTASTAVVRGTVVSGGRGFYPHTVPTPKKG